MKQEDQGGFLEKNVGDVSLGKSDAHEDAAAPQLAYEAPVQDPEQMTSAVLTKENSRG